MATILQFFRKGEDEFETLLRPHLEFLFTLAFKFTGSQVDAQDLVQEFLLQLYTRKSSLAQVDELKPWLVKGLYYRYIDSRRRASRDPLGDYSVDVDVDHYHSGSDSQQHTESAIYGAIIHNSLKMLNKDQRALVTLHDMEGYSLPELQNMLEIPIGTLKSRLHRARNILRREMEPFLQNERDKG